MTAVRERALKSRTAVPNLFELSWPLREQAKSLLQPSSRLLKKPKMPQRHEAAPSQ